MRKPLVVLAAAGLLAACASTYNQNLVTPAAGKLQRGKAVLIATPKSGSYENHQYFASGRQTADAAKAAFGRFSERVSVSSRCSELACLQDEAMGGADYFVVPRILHWEDRNTEWSGKPDRIEIGLVVAEARGAGILASVVLTGQSKWATFGGDHPQDLLPEPIKAFVDSLY
jgi:hypothetical protein